MTGVQTCALPIYTAGAGSAGAVNGDTVRFISNSDGRLERIILNDGRQFAYSYDDVGNLTSVRDLSAAQSSRYGFDAGDAHLMTLATGGIGDGGEAIRYESGAPIVNALTDDLGGALSYLTQNFSGNLTAGATRPEERRAGKEGRSRRSP